MGLQMSVQQQSACLTTDGSVIGSVESKSKKPDAGAHHNLTQKESQVPSDGSKDDEWALTPLLLLREVGADAAGKKVSWAQRDSGA